MSNSSDGVRWGSVGVRWGSVEDLALVTAEGKPVRWGSLEGPLGVRWGTVVGGPFADKNIFIIEYPF